MQRAIEAAERKREADVANGKDAAIAAAEFNAEVTQLLGIADSAGAAKDRLKAMAGTYEIDVNTIYRTSHIGGNDPKAGGSRNPDGRASGGRAWPGFVDVGEQGPERLYIDPGAGPAYVTPNSAINGAANGGGGDVQTLRVILEWPDGTVIRDRLVNFGRGRGYRTVDQLLPVGTAR